MSVPTRKSSITGELGNHSVFTWPMTERRYCPLFGRVGNLDSQLLFQGLDVGETRIGVVHATF